MASKYDNKVDAPARMEMARRFVAGEKTAAIAADYGVSDPYPAQLAKKLLGGRVIDCPHCGTPIKVGDLKFKSRSR